MRTIDKEWPDKHPRPGMRPTLGGPGIQQNQKQVRHVTFYNKIVLILKMYIYGIRPQLGA